MTVVTCNLGFSLINLSNNHELFVWGDTPGQTSSPPVNIPLGNGITITNPVIGNTYANLYTFLPRIANTDPELNTLITGETVNANSSQVTVTYTYRTPTQTELLNYAANTRWYCIENGNYNANGVVVPTDDSSQASLTSIITLMTLYPNTVINFKVANGSFITANGTIMTSLAYSVAGFVQTCFGMESIVGANVLSNTITTFAQIDSAFANLVIAGSANVGAVSLKFK
jgi:hypothetical protein